MNGLITSYTDTCSGHTRDSKMVNKCIKQLNGRKVHRIKKKKGFFVFILCCSKEPVILKAF